MTAALQPDFKSAALIERRYNDCVAVIPRPYREYKQTPRAPGARRRVLAEWRGLDLTPLEKLRAVRVRKAEDVLPKVLADLRIDRRRAEAEVLKVWNNLIDPLIVAHAQPTGLHKGTLYVTVDSSVCLTEIVRYRRREILDRLQHGFGRDLIARISFRVG